MLLEEDTGGGTDIFMPPILMHFQLAADSRYWESVSESRTPNTSFGRGCNQKGSEKGETESMCQPCPSLVESFSKL